MSWYHARETCLRERGRLGVIEDISVFEQIKRQLQDTLGLSGDYWVGYTDSILQWHSGMLAQLSRDKMTDIFKRQILKLIF